MQREIYTVRMLLVGAVIFGAFFSLGMHYHHIQVERHEELYNKAQARYTESEKTQGERGRIYDRNGHLLVGNLACRDVLAEPARFTPRRLEVIALLDAYLDVDRDVLVKRFSRALNPELNVVEVVVQRHVGIEKAQKLAEILERKNLLKGFRFVESTRRYYPKGELLANTLGFLNAEQEGACGIERLMDAQLQPSETQITYEVGRLGRQLNALRRPLKRSTDGADIRLTISEPIQQIVEEELERVGRKHEPNASFAVMMDPDTGQVMALAQRPTFNPNKRRNMSPQRWQNRAVTGGFEPGSIMKPLSIAGALDYGTVSVKDRYDCEQGAWYYAGEQLHDAHQFGELYVPEIIQKSSNIGTAKIAVQMGDRRLYQTLRRFGFGQTTGIGFRNEAEGILRPPRRWSKIAVTRLAIGQGVLVTPLQLVQAYAAIANDGLMMEPQIIRGVEDSAGEIRQKPKPKVKQRAIRKASAKVMKNIMKLVTQEGGTAPEASIPGYEVAGKTGTAQKVIDGKYSHEHYVSSFIGFVPAEDAEFVLLVTVDDPSKEGYYASQVAAPAFQRIARKTLRYLQVSPEIAQKTESYGEDSEEVAHAAGISVSDVR